MKEQKLKQKKQKQQMEVQGINPIAQNNSNGENLTNDSDDSLVSYPVNDDDDSYLDTFPPGYRFKPSDGELVFHYLQMKILNKPLPPNRIKAVELYRFHPKKLVETCKSLGEKEWYFFTPRKRKYPNGLRPNRAAEKGYWKATGADKPVKHNGSIVGFKKSLVFYKGKAPKGEKTGWIMHEYRVDDPPKIRKSGDVMRLDDWVLCRIHQKNRSARASTRKKDNSVQEQKIENETALTQSQDSVQISVEGTIVPRAETFKPEGHGHGIVDMSDYCNQGIFFNEYDDVFLSSKSPYVNFPHCQQGSQDFLPTFLQSYDHPLGFQQIPNSSVDEPSSARPHFLPTDSNMKFEQLGYHLDEDSNLPTEDLYFDPLAHNFMDF